MPLLNSVIPILACDKCEAELQPGEGVFFEDSLLCYPHYEEALEALALSYRVDQIRSDYQDPIIGLVILFD